MDHATSPLDRHLAAMLGPGAEFREGQREAVEAVLADRSRALVVQRTGWGKSLVYWIASRVRRDAGHGPTLIISPLLALMRNQIEMAARLGLRAVTIHSGNREEWTAVEERLSADEVDVLLISPERLANQDFTSRVLPSMGDIGLFVIDEAHCISDWGHDFRPDYRRIGRLLRVLPASVPVLATTATANNRVVDDVVEQLGDDVRVIRGPLARDTLRLDAIDLADQAERLAWLAEQIPRLPGSGVVYCLTIADTERVTGWLRSRDIDARAYSGPMPTNDREALEQALIGNELKALVATVALGMGFDKPDLGFVIHYQRPGSPIAYYQQVGRAGRAVERSYGILLSGREDDEIADYFLRTAFPPTVRMREILDVLEAVDDLTVTDLQRRVNLPRRQIEQALKLLEIDGAVAKSGSRWSRTAVPWEQDEQRIERVKATRKAELQQMREYVAHDGCYMEFLIRLLDDPDARPCGRCANDVGRGFSATVDPDLVQAALRFLRRDLRPIEPRRLWVDVQSGAGRKIDPANEPGFALCVYGDPGWGQEVARGKYEEHRFSQGLVNAAAGAIRDRWRPDPAPEWVTAVPSRGRASLVGDFAGALARELGLPYVECLTSTVDGAAQKEMQNSVLQLENARRKVGLIEDQVRPEPVLLVDDIVDSGWTLTVAGALLRASGSGPVYPFALAIAGQRDA
ncbi:MAG TPA: RecQ family ATP-dependent DNA helicase [Candidatus Limnocylindrales bacterium]|nr:RecQ family ATP-dependent DNA helicase [Candidatus Limnocylindrales bacterium]